MDTTGPARSAFEPGIVEVEFRSGVQPEIVSAAEGRAQISSPSDADLSGLNDILQQHELQSAEPSFLIEASEADELQASMQEQGEDVPNLANFVRLQFPPDADTQEIARELAQLPEIERAVAVPKVLPPQSPLNEPLVGTTDTVVLNSGTGLENQWYIFRCRANHAWSMASGNGVVIADIDWGYRVTHQDLASRLDLTRAYNSYDGGTNVSTGGSGSLRTAHIGIARGAHNNLRIARLAYGATLGPGRAQA